MLIHHTQKFASLRYLFILLPALLILNCSQSSTHSATEEKPVVGSEANSQLPPGLTIARQAKDETADKQTSIDVPEDMERFLLPTPQVIQPFKLHDHNGSDFTEQRFNGKWNFLVFGYTNCPDVCPTTLAEMDDFTALLPGANLKDQTQVYFVSLDPKRDTDKELKEYLGYFNSHFIGVSGSESELHHFCSPLDISFKYEPITKTMYSVTHSSSVILVDPKSRYVARFAIPINAEELLKKYQKIIQTLSKSG